MSRDPKIRRKDLKSPDEFVTATQRVLAVMRDHERETLLAIGALVALIAIVLGVRSYRSWRDGQASDAFRSAFKAYASEDLATARKGFETVGVDWRGSQWGTLAHVYLGDVAVQSKDAAAAQAAFEKALESADDPSLRQIAEYNLGVLKRNAGDGAAANDHFRRAAGLDGPYRSAALVALAAADGGPSQAPPEARAEADELLPPEIREFVAARAPGSLSSAEKVE
ncbi:MAG: tetratricopeptide repeat protein [Candidatus Binatia bacterium]